MKNTKSIGVAVLSSLVSLLLVACDKPGPAEKAGKKLDNIYTNATNSISNSSDKASEVFAKQSDNADQLVTDIETTARVKVALAKNESLRFEMLNVATDNNIVTISGTVKSSQNKQDAIAIVESTKGVSAVISKISVSHKG